MRALRIIGIVVGCFVAAVIIALIAIRLLVNPNDYKGRIEQLVKSSTGRELSLPGDIKLSVFPWIAVQLGPASLGNPPGFGSQPFASLQHASLRVRLLPLLRKQLDVGRVEVDGLDLRLLKNAQGHGNWEGFGGSGSASSSGSGGSLRELGGVVVKDSRVSYQDMVADHVGLDIGRVAGGASVPIDWKLDLTTSRGAKPIGIAGKATLIPDLAKHQYRLAPLSVSGTMTPAAGAAAVQWKLAVPDASFDLNGETFAIPAFTAQLASAQLSGSVRGNLKGNGPSADGTFKLEPVSLRQLMSQLAVTPPQTRDPKALSSFAASGTFAYGGNAARARNLDVRLDDSTLRGSAAITNLNTYATTFDLSLDRIDLDRYRGPEAPPSKSAAQPAKSGQKPTEQPTELPTQMIKRLRMNGKAAIGSATVAGLKLTQVRVGIAANGGVMHIAPAVAQLYGGAYTGDVTLDARSVVPVLTLDQQMTGIDVAPLLQDFAKTRRLSGRGNVTTKLTARGRTTSDLIKTLDGRVTANLANGAIEGIDLWTAVNNAVALAEKRTVPTSLGGGRTKFDVFRASADLTNGVASTKDLNIASGDLRVTGQGTSNLVTGAVDYRVQATVLKGAGKSSGTLADIPLLVTGTMTSPSVRPDVQGLAKSFARRELEKHKGEVQNKLQNALKGLFH